MIWADPRFGSSMIWADPRTVWRIPLCTTGMLIAWLLRMLKPRRLRPLLLLLLLPALLLVTFPKSGMSSSISSVAPPPLNLRPPNRGADELRRPLPLPRSRPRFRTAAATATRPIRMPKTIPTAKPTFGPVLSPLLPPPVARSVAVFEPSLDVRRLPLSPPLVLPFDPYDGGASVVVSSAGAFAPGHTVDTSNMYVGGLPTMKLMYS